MKSNEYIGKFLTVLDNMDKNGNHIPGLIMSHAGFGKTSTVSKWCEYMNYGLVTLVPSTCSADDILGLQSIKDGELVRLTPSWYNNLIKVSNNGKKRVLLFIDEISATDPYIQAPLLNLIFNRDLGEQKLPENCLIVSAGNYSEDLGGNFRMSSPLVNRFLILNLSNDDLDFKDVLSFDFDNVTTKEDIKKYLGLDDSEDNKSYSIDKFKKWISDSREVQFGSSSYEENSFGLMGFTTVRSLTYSLKFAEEYMRTFHDNVWMRIVGDTLGMSNKREGKCMSMILESNYSEFLSSSREKESVKTISELCNEMTKNGLDSSLLKELEELVSNTSIEDIPDRDFSILTKFIRNFCNDSRVQYINRNLLAK